MNVFFNSLIFKCFNSYRTIKFYSECLGMHLKREAASEDGQLGYFFMCHDHPNNITLRFECEKLKEVNYRKAERCSRSGDTTHLLIYVRNLRDVLSSIEQTSTGAWIYNESTNQAGILVALVIDPNGYLLQLVESVDELLMESETDSNTVEVEAGFTWNVRIGYIVCPCQKALEIAKYYQELFENANLPTSIDSRTENKKEGRNLKLVNGGANENANIKAKDHQLVQQQANKIGNLRIIDIEDFTQLLATYVWVGNGTRSKYTCLCFRTKINRQNASFSHLVRNVNVKAAIAEAEKPTVFLGFGFRSTNLEQLVVSLGSHVQSPVVFMNQIEYFKGIGNTARFKDHEGNLVELLDDESAVLEENPITDKMLEVMRNKAGKHRKMTARRKSSRIKTSDREQYLNRQRMAQYIQLENKRKNTKLVGSTNSTGITSSINTIQPLPTII